MAEQYVIDGGDKKVINEFAALPENVACERLRQTIVVFMAAMPFANTMGINLIVTLIGTIGKKIGSDDIVEIIGSMNEDILSS